MHPLKYTKEDMTKLKNKTISIKVLYDTDKYVWIGGKIRQIYLAYNPPNLPGSIDFEISQDSKRILEKAKIEIPENIGIMDIAVIDETEPTNN